MQIGLMTNNVGKRRSKKNLFLWLCFTVKAIALQ